MAVSNIGYFLLFMLMGVWHGLALQYIVYGLYHAVLMTGYNFLRNGIRNTSGCPPIVLRPFSHRHHIPFRMFRILYFLRKTISSLKEIENTWNLNRKY